MRIVSTVFAMLLLVLPVQAQQQDIESVISRQLDSFQQDDFVSAFEFAAPNIVGMFRTPENFARMVTQGYPMVYRPAEVQFQDLSVENGLYKQRVLFRDQAGAYYSALYTMVSIGGMWKIAGVSIERAPGVGA